MVATGDIRDFLDEAEAGRHSGDHRQLGERTSVPVYAAHGFSGALLLEVSVMIDELSDFRGAFTPQSDEKSDLNKANLAVKAGAGQSLCLAAPAGAEEFEREFWCCLTGNALVEITSGWPIGSCR